jgi:hypothetical protein
MKLATVDYTYTVICTKTVEVPDDIKFSSTKPDEMVDEIDFDISDIDVHGLDVVDVGFDGIRSVDLDETIYPF